MISMWTHYCDYKILDLKHGGCSIVRTYDFVLAIIKQITLPDVYYWIFGFTTWREKGRLKFLK